MKALTICQPYAFLICLPETDPRHKRVENREWPTNCRGPLAIHAGKSREWIQWDAEEVREEMYDITLAQMHFGAVVAIAQLVDCLLIDTIRHRYHDARHPWLRGHIHTSGTWCWVLQDVKPLSKPIPYRGAQGLFEISDEVLA